MVKQTQVAFMDHNQGMNLCRVDDLTGNTGIATKRAVYLNQNKGIWDRWAKRLPLDRTMAVRRKA